MANIIETEERIRQLAREIYIQNVTLMSSSAAFDAAEKFIAREDRRATEVQEQRKREVSDLLSRSAHCKGGYRRG